MLFDFFQNNDLADEVGVNTFFKFITKSRQIKN